MKSRYTFNFLTISLITPYLLTLWFTSCSVKLKSINGFTTGIEKKTIQTNFRQGCYAVQLKQNSISFSKPLFWQLDSIQDAQLLNTSRSNASFNAGKSDSTTIKSIYFSSKFNKNKKKILKMVQGPSPTLEYEFNNVLKGDTIDFQNLRFPLIFIKNNPNSPEELYDYANKLYYTISDSSYAASIDSLFGRNQIAPSIIQPKHFQAMYDTQPKSIKIDSVLFKYNDSTYHIKIDKELIINYNSFTSGKDLVNEKRTACFYLFAWEHGKLIGLFSQKNTKTLEQDLLMNEANCRFLNFNVGTWLIDCNLLNLQYNVTIKNSKGSTVFDRNINTRSLQIKDFFNYKKADTYHVTIRGGSVI